MNKKRKAFTLIEMVIVLFIISLLLLIMVPNMAAQKKNADNKSDAAFRTTLKTQAELYSQNVDVTDDKITVTLLREKDYLTDAQVKKAKKLNLDQSNDLIADLNKEPNAKSN